VSVRIPRTRVFCVESPGLSLGCLAEKEEKEAMGDELNKRRLLKSKRRCMGEE